MVQESKASELFCNAILEHRFVRLVAAFWFMVSVCFWVMIQGFKTLGPKEF